jgi:hypothetical protein
MNANFSEPRSLFGGGGNNLSVNASSSKKKRILGLPFDYSDQKKVCPFDLNLETV